MAWAYSRTKLVHYIVDALDSGVAETDIAKKVAAYLIDSGKTSDLNSVMRDAQDLRAAKYGVVELDVRSAHDLDSVQVKQVESVAKRQYPGAKKVSLNKIHDESVVAGASLSFAHAQFDVTVRTKLNRLREAIS